MNDSSLHFALREMRALFSNLRVLAGFAVVTLMLGLAGPFQTYDILPLGPRLAYWAAISFGAFSVATLAGSWAAEALKRRKARMVLIVAGAGLAASLPATAMVMVINLLAFGPDVLGAFSALEAFVYILVISIGVAVLFAVFETARPEAGQAETPPPILKRLPVQKRGPLVSLSVQDHYVEVTTGSGRHLILMRLTDAMDETEGAKGLQIHRSHWVALDQVEAVDRSGGKWLVTTKAGDQLPVSRSFQPAARDAGLLV